MKAVLNLIVANLWIWVFAGSFISCLLSGTFCVSVPLLSCDWVFFAALSWWMGWDFGVFWTSCPAEEWGNSFLIPHSGVAFPSPHPCVCQGMAARDCLLWSLLGSVWFWHLPEPETGREIKSKHAGRYLNEYLLTKHLSPPEALPPNSARPQGHGYLISPQAFTCLCPWKCCLSSLILMISFCFQRWLFRNLIRAYGQSVVFLIFRSSLELWTLDMENI